MSAVARPPHVIDHPSEHLVQGLNTAVEGALWNYGPLRSSKAILSVDVTPEGQVTLRGAVISEMLKSMAARLAASVPGVAGVRNELVTDAEIETAIAEILAGQALPLFTDQLQLESRLGVAYMGGTVVAADPEAAEQSLRSASEAIAALPAVRQVIYDVDVLAGGEAFVAATEDENVSGPGPEQAAIQERLKIWKERAAAKST